MTDWVVLTRLLQAADFALHPERASFVLGLEYRGMRSEMS